MAMSKNHDAALIASDSEEEVFIIEEEKTSSSLQLSFEILLSELSDSESY